MGKRKVKEYSADFKTKVILEVLRQDQTQAEIASKYQISAANISSLSLKNWTFLGRHILSLYATLCSAYRLILSM